VNSEFHDQRADYDDYDDIPKKILSPREMAHQKMRLAEYWFYVGAIVVGVVAVTLFMGFIETLISDKISPSQINEMLIISFILMLGAGIFAAFFVAVLRMHQFRAYHFVDGMAVGGVAFILLSVYGAYFYVLGILMLIVIRQPRIKELFEKPVHSTWPDWDKPNEKHQKRLRYSIEAISYFMLIVGVLLQLFAISYVVIIQYAQIEVDVLTMYFISCISSFFGVVFLFTGYSWRARRWYWVCYSVAVLLCILGLIYIVGPIFAFFGVRGLIALHQPKFKSEFEQIRL
jgi:MFS family permease